MRRYSGGHVVAIGVTVMTLCLGGAILALDHLIARQPQYFGLTGTVRLSDAGADQIDVAYWDGPGAEKSVRFVVRDPALFKPGDRFGLLLLSPPGTIYPEEVYGQHVRGYPRPPLLDTTPSEVRSVLLPLAIFLLACWAVRAYFTASATDAPVTRARARHRTPIGDDDAGTENRVLGRHLIELTTWDRDLPSALLQPVLWSPDLERLVDGTIVNIRVGRGPLRRAVIDLPDGGRLWPAGRARGAYGGERVSSTPPESTWPSLLLAVVSLGSGAALAFLLQGALGAIALPTGIAAGVGLGAHFWAWSGGFAGRPPTH
ncbi:hypothetical protein FDA94_09285 [Herbidospora galbida]|uniref:Uncharacterized protein n=1 Tax=Herbidospora galbida TaxID=2575442 RepID=A0A4V5UZQ7_9ACTN|nr:hypothetical protein [Herbidospora galbida]TKK89573.1 hypothetical protein FDA94_09285 [Herbidospora galbida]